MESLLIGLLSLVSLVFMIMIVVMLYLLLRLREQIHTLQSRMTNLERRLQAMPSKDRLPSKGMEPQPAPTDMPHTPRWTWDPSLTKPSASPQSPSTPVVSPGAAGNSPVYSKPAKPSRTRAEWELLIGGKWLNRIGAVALITGLGFFLKYAFDHQWLNETARVMIGALVATVLFGLGIRWHNKGLPIFAQGLFGAGIAIGYLTVYASFNFYHLVPQAVALVLMSGVTVISFAAAVRYDSPAVSVLGWAGGYLTPFLLSMGKTHAVGLFSYISLLAAGLLWILWKKPSWLKWLLPLTAGATYLVYASWLVFLYEKNQWGSAIGFLTVFWTLFTLFDVIRVRRFHVRPQPEQLTGRIVAGVNAGLFLTLSYSVLHFDHEKVNGLLVLAAGMVYFLLSRLGRKQGWQNADIAQYELAALSYVAIATAMFFSGATLAVIWSIEGVAVAWIGAKQEDRWNWIAVSVLYGLAFFQWIIETVSMDIFHVWPLLNRQSLVTWVLALSLAAAGWWARSLPDKPGTVLSRTYQGVGAFLLFFWSGFQTHVWIAQRLEATDTGVVHAPWGINEPLWLSLAWLVYGLAMVWMGTRFRLPVPIWAGAGAYGLAVCAAVVSGSSYDPIETFIPVANIRFGALASLAVGGWLLSRYWISFPVAARWSRWIRTAAHATVFFLVWELLTVETNDVFERLIHLADDTQIHRLINLQQLSLSAVWLLYSIILMGIGIVRRMQAVRITAIGLFGITILKIFILDLSFLDTLYRIFSFIGLGLILLAVSFVYQRYRDVLQLGGENKEHRDV